MCIVNINYGDQIFGKWEVICRVNKYDIKKYIFNNYEKIYIMLGVCGLNEVISWVNWCVWCILV